MSRNKDTDQARNSMKRDRQQDTVRVIRGGLELLEWNDSPVWSFEWTDPNRGA